MKLYHISQSEVRGYDTYSDAVVCAHSKEDAASIHPGWGDNPWKNCNGSYWCKSPHSVTVKYLGEAGEGIERGVICASFHAG